jgi:methionyl-tRNA synthetase
VPQPGALDDADRELLAGVEAGFDTVGALYSAYEFRAALGKAIALAREANGYTFAPLPSAPLRIGSAGLDRKAPWVQIKQDKAAAATTVYTILRVVDNLKTLLAPVLPHTAQRLHEYLGYEGQLFGTQQVVEYRETSRSHPALTYDHHGATGAWAPSSLPAGQRLCQPAPLFKKLDESVVEEETARLAG